MNPGFTQKYGLKRLVYYESHGDVNKAIAREKAIKNWPRKWKLDLIESINPNWLDLYEEIYQQRRMIMCLDPKAKAGRVLVAVKKDESRVIGHGSDRLDSGSGPE